MAESARVALHSSQSSIWYTPPKILVPVREVYGGTIDLDPASDARANAIVQATRYFDQETNGLKQTWYGNVFNNPPYSSDGGAKAWTEKGVAERDNYEALMFLLNATPDRKWFVDLWPYTICFLYKRVRFLEPLEQCNARRAKRKKPPLPNPKFVGPEELQLIEGPQPTHGNILAYLGDDPRRFIEVLRPWGQIVQGGRALTEESIIMTDVLGLAVDEATTHEEEEKPTIAPFDKISSNVKGFKGEIGVTSTVAFVGENETGKTAALDAVRLALTGKHPAGLPELIPEKAESLFAIVQGASGSSTFSLAKGKLKGKKLDPPTRKGKLGDLTDEDLEHVMPTVSIGDMLEGWGAQRTRNAVVTRFVDLPGVPAPEAMSDAQEALWEQALTELTTKDGEEIDFDPTEVLAGIGKWMHSVQLDKSKKKKHLEEQIESLNKEVTEESAGDELIPELEAKLKQAQKWEAQAKNREDLKAAEEAFAALKTEAESINDRTSKLTEQKEKLDALEAKIAEVIADTQDIVADQKAEEAKLAEKFTRGKVVQSILDAMVKHNVDRCPVCFHDSDHDHVVQRAKDMAELVAERQEEYEIAQNDLRVTLQGIDEREAEVLRAKQAFANATQELENTKTDLRNRGAQVKARLDALKNATSDVEYIGPSSTELEAQIESLHAADAKKRQLQDITTQLAQTTATHEAVTKLKKEAKHLLQETLSQIQSTAESAVNKYMPDGFKAVLDLEGSNCEWRAVSRRDGRPHGKSASGAQKCALVIALALAWTENSPIRILIVDDKELHGFSKANVQAFLTMVKEHVDAGLLTQAFVAWSRPDEIPADWQKVEMK